MNWMDGWQERSEAPIGWTKGQRRKTVAVICCEECGGTALSRETRHVRVQYWKCNGCGHLQKEIDHIGQGRAVLP